MWANYILWQQVIYCTFKTYCIITVLLSTKWYAVAQLVEALRYKPEGHGFNSNGVIGIFHLHNPSGSTMALGSTQPLTETLTGICPKVKGGRCVGLTPSYTDCLEFLGASTC